MKNTARTVLAAGAAVLVLGASAGTASAAPLGDTADGTNWYIGSGNAYGEVIWDDHAHDGEVDMDDLILNDDYVPSGYSVRMTVVHDSFKKTVHTYNGNFETVHIPGFYNGETAKFKAFAWDEGEPLTSSCRSVTITE